MGEVLLKLIFYYFFVEGSVVLFDAHVLYLVVALLGGNV